MKFQPSLLAIACLVGTVGISLPVKANSSPNIPLQIAQSSSQMETQMTFQGKDKIDTMIRESGSEFHFHGTLTRTSGNMFTGSDNQVNVSYDQSSGRIVIVNKVTGTQFYNYIYSGNSNTNTSGTQTNSQYNVSKLQDL